MHRPPETVGSLLGELRTVLAPRLEEPALQAALAEIEAHLAEGIEGRIELGLDPDVAEREAVLAFGDAHRIGQSLADEATVQRSVARLRWLGVAYAILIALAVAGPLVYHVASTLDLALYALIAFAVSGFARASFRTRRAAPISIAATGFGATAILIALAGSTWLNLWAFGGRGCVPPLDSDRNAKLLATRLQTVRASQATLDEANATLRGGAGIEAFRTPQGYRAPETRSWYAGSDPLRMRFVPTAAEAQAAWADVARRMNQFDDADLQSDLEAMEQAAAHPIQNTLSFVSQCAPVGALATGAAVFLDLAMSGLGLAWSRRRTRPNRGIRA